MHRKLFQVGLSIDFIDPGETHGRSSGNQDKEWFSKPCRFRIREREAQGSFQQAVSRGLYGGQGEKVLRQSRPDAGAGHIRRRGRARCG